MIRGLTLMDDIFFSKCFSGSTECTALLLRVILGREDLTVVEARTQSWMQSILSHSVKLDIYARDREGNVYDIEIQKTVKDAGRRRARYYSAMMDSAALGKGEGYERLPESYVIFITAQDAIGEGKALYTVERMIKETGEEFGDGAHIVYVSSEAAEEGTELGRLMHDLGCAEPEEMSYTELRERVSYFKGNVEGIAEMASEFDELIKRVRDSSLKEGEEKGLREGEKRGHRIGIEQGLSKGARNNAIQVARNMIADGSIPLSKVAEFSGLSLGEVESIRQSI